MGALDGLLLWLVAKLGKAAWDATKTWTVDIADATSGLAGGEEDEVLASVLAVLWWPARRLHQLANGPAFDSNANHALQQATPVDPGVFAGTGRHPRGSIRELNEHLVIRKGDWSDTVQIRLHLRLLSEQAARPSRCTLEALKRLAVYSTEGGGDLPLYAKLSQLVPSREL